MSLLISPDTLGILTCDAAVEDRSSKYCDNANEIEHSLRLGRKDNFSAFDDENTDIARSNFSTPATITESSSPTVRPATLPSDTTPDFDERSILHLDTLSISHSPRPPSDSQRSTNTSKKVEQGRPAELNNKQPDVVRDIAQDTGLDETRYSDDASDKATDDGMNLFSKELRRLKQQIGDALLMNTQWRQEQSKLEYCRNYLTESMDSMVQAVRGRRFVDTRSAIVQRKDTLARKRLGLEPFEEPGSELLTVSDLSSDSYVAGSNATEAKGLDSSGSPTSPDITDKVTDKGLQNLYNQFMNDYSSVQSQAKMVTALSDDMGNAMYRLASKLDALSKRLESPEFGGQLGRRTVYDTGSLLDAPSHHHSGADTPPLVREFFEKLGDIGIFEERLMELEDTYQEGLIHRDFVKDRLEELEVSDEEFRASHEHRCYYIQRDLDNAMTLAEELRQKCIEAGLEVDQHRERRESLYSSSHAPSSRLDDDDDQAFAYYQIRQIQAPEPMHSLGTTRIGEWLNDLNSDKEPIEPFADTSSLIDDDFSPVSTKSTTAAREESFLNDFTSSIGERFAPDKTGESHDSHETELSSYDIWDGASSGDNAFLQQESTNALDSIFNVTHKLLGKEDLASTLSLADSQVPDPFPSKSKSVKGKRTQAKRSSRNPDVSGINKLDDPPQAIEDATRKHDMDPDGRSTPQDRAAKRGALLTEPQRTKDSSEGEGELHDVKA